MGHFIISYIWFIYFANKMDKSNYDSPRIDDRIKKLNKSYLYELVGIALAEIEQKIINSTQKIENDENY